MSIIVLAPLLIALGVAAVLWWRRPSGMRLTTVLLGSLLLALGWALVALSERPAACRAVVILDQREPSAKAVSRVNAVIDRLASDGLVGYDVVRVEMRQPPTASDEPQVGSRQWQLGAWQPADDLIAPTPASAIELACLRLTTTPWLERLTDTAMLRTRRIIVLASAPEAWKDQHVDIPSAAGHLKAADATVDVLVEAIDDPTPTLEIVFDRPSIAPYTHFNDATAVRLRLRSPQLARAASHTANFEIAAEIDGVDGADGNKAKTFAARPKGSARISADGRIEVEVLLRDFKSQDETGRSLNLEPGFHLLRATITIEAEGRKLSATAERYLRVAGLAVAFVSGTAGRFSIEASPQTLQYAWEGLPRWIDRWPPGAEFDSFWSVADLIRPGQSRPYLLVLHEFGSADWLDPEPTTKVKAVDVIERWLREGTHLIVSGVPPDTPPMKTSLKFLPAFAASMAPGPESWRFDRRPRLIFIRDASRLGKLPYAPFATNQLAPPAQLPGRHFEPLGWDLQRTLIDAVRKELSLAKDGYVQVGELTVNGLSSPDPAEDLYRPSRVADRLAQLLAAPPPGLSSMKCTYDGEPGGGHAPTRPDWEIGINDTVVIITYEGIKQPDTVGALSKLLARGATVLDVRLRSPFQDGANAGVPAGYIELDRYFEKEMTQLAEEQLKLGADAPLSNDAAEAGYDRVGTLGLTTIGQPAGNADLQSLAKQLATRIRPKLNPHAQVITRHRLDRFIDERIGLPLSEGVSPDASEAQDKCWAAPVRFQWLRPISGASYASACWPKDAKGASAPRPLICGGQFGRAAVLCLGYSLFEGASRKNPAAIPLEPAVGISFRDYESWPVVDRIFPPPLPKDLPDHWGPQRVIDLATFHADLEPLPSSQPLLRNVEIADRRGRLRFECIVSLPSETGPPNAAPTPIPSLSIGPTPNGRALPPLQPADFQPLRGRLFYELTPNDAAALLGNAPGGPVKSATVRVGGDVLFLRGREVSPQSDLPDGLTETATLARYSGGTETDRTDGLTAVPIGVRIPAALAFACTLAALWGARAGRRLLRTRSIARQSKAEAERLRVDDAAGLVAQAGESLGRPTGTLRAGAFAGYRGFEPGDRLDFALRDDLILSSVFGIPIIPRIPQRVDDRSTRILLIINAGRSMRLPAAGRRNPAPKLAAAAAIAELLAALAWERRAEVTVHLTGVLPLPSPLGPLPGAVGQGELTRYVLSAGASSLRWKAPLALPPLDEGGGSLIYISDFLNEDSSALSLQLAAFEHEGGGCGAIHVFSPLEHHLLDFGIAPAAGVFSERSEWTSDDLEAAHHRFVEQLQGLWEDSRGGLAVVSAAFPPAQMLQVIRDSRLLDLFR